MHRTPSDLWPSRGPAVPVSCLLLSVLFSCDSGQLNLPAKSALDLGPAPSELGSTALRPGDLPGPGSGKYLIDGHQGGQGSELHLLGLAWGRLVDLYDREDASGRTRLVYADFVIGPEVRSESGKWTLFTDQLVGAPRLVVEREDTASPEDAFDRLVLELEQTQVELEDQGLGRWTTGSPTTIARDAALVLSFDDLVDERTAWYPDSVQLFVGAGARVPFEGRLIADPNHGGIAASDGRFHSTRLILDTTVDPEESLGLGAQGPANGWGLPAGDGAQEVNLALRLPTRSDPAAGRFRLLSNLAGRPLAAEGSGSFDADSSTRDVVRGLATRGEGDPDQGYLTQSEGPRLIARLPVHGIRAAQDPAGLVGRDWVVDLGFESAEALSAVAPGDWLRGAGVSAEVIANGSAVGTRLEGLRLRAVEPVSTRGWPTEAELISAWRDQTPAAAAGAFLRFSPAVQRTGGQGVLPEAQVLVEFSKPVDPRSIDPFGNFVVRSLEAAGQLHARVVGQVIAEAGGRLLRFAPLLPFAHTTGRAEPFSVELAGPGAGGGLNPLMGLAGQPVQSTPQSMGFTIAASSPGAQTGSLSLAFGSPSEDNFPGPDWRGQFLYNFTLGQMLPRPLQHFSLVCDRTQPVVSQMQAISTGLQTPLSNLGSKLHMLWRYCDLGLSQSMSQDDVFSNLDAEGIALAPIGGQVMSTFYPEFAMLGGHSDRLPDEALDSNLLPLYQNSGFFPNASFEENFLDDPEGGPKRLHPKSAGFLVASGDLFVAPTNTVMLPFPWNRNVAPEDRTYLTWRDTAIQSLGGQNSQGTGLTQPGVPVAVDVAISGVGAPGGAYGQSSPNQVTPLGIPTVGLPLLMEFRCYPGSALSLNNFDVSIAVSTSPRPSFRAFSTGGFNLQGQAVVKDPDLELVPSGGFNGNPAIGPVGAATLPRDPTVYLGQLDLVTRISRAHSVLFDTQQPDPDYAGVVVSPSAARQPAGTAIAVAFRGDDSPSLPLNSPYLDAALLDVYGEPLFANNSLVLDQPIWSEDINAIDGQRFVQLRLTFISNPVTGQSPRLSGLGLTWRY